MSKLITVFGATGNQGGSVIRAIQADPKLSKEFKIRGITRDTTKPAAQELAKKGVEVVSADMGSASSLGSAIKDSHTVFLVTNYWESVNREIEFSHGKNVADAAKATGVSQLIFSSLINTTEASAGKLKNIPHFDGKADIEKYIRLSGTPATFVLPGFFMSNLTQSIRKGDDGTYTFVVPETKKPLQFPLFDVAETGKWVIAAIKHRDQVLGKQIYAAQDYYTPDRIVKEFSEVTGHHAKVVQVPADTYKSFLPPQVAQELLENHLLLAEPGYYVGASLKEGQALLDSPPTSWKEFVKRSDAWKV